MPASNYRCHCEGRHARGNLLVLSIDLLCRNEHPAVRFPRRFAPRNDSGILRFGRNHQAKKTGSHNWLPVSFKLLSYQIPCSDELMDIEFERKILISLFGQYYRNHIAALGLVLLKPQEAVSIAVFICDALCDLYGGAVFRR